MYNFDKPVVMKVCINSLCKIYSHDFVLSSADRFTNHPSPVRLSSGLRAPAAAGADPTGRRLLGQNTAGIPADETHAGQQSDHGGPAEVPTMPH